MGIFCKPSSCSHTAQSVGFCSPLPQLRTPAAPAGLGAWACGANAVLHLELLSNPFKLSLERIWGDACQKSLSRVAASAHRGRRSCHPGPPAGREGAGPRPRVRSPRRAPTGCGGSEAEHRLYAALFKNYNQFVRPVKNVSDPVIIQFEVSMSQLVKVVSTRPPGAPAGQGRAGTVPDAALFYRTKSTR